MNKRALWVGGLGVAALAVGGGVAYAVTRKGGKWIPVQNTNQLAAGDRVRIAMVRESALDPNWQRDNEFAQGQRDGQFRDLRMWAPGDAGPSDWPSMPFLAVASYRVEFTIVNITGVGANKSLELTWKLVK